jgi:DNA-binding LytR/AlgR family response regulator
MPKRRILIVEDDVFIALDLESIVAKAVDAEILLSRSVARAKDLIEQSLDLALLDVDVTNGKTFEVAMLLKLRQVPFVFLTGSRREEIPDEFRDAPFIAKPYEPGRLVDQIRKIIPDASE